MIKKINPDKEFNSDILYNEQFPLSNKYDPKWILTNQMSPNPLWQTEFLAEPFDLKPGMRVLDLGCGKGITSVFLAREYGVQVYAVDFDQWSEWTSPEERWENAKEYGVEHLVIPISADAKKLPFAQGFFDAIICVNSYFYYGKDELYLENITRFLRPGGKIGMIVPGFMRDVSNGVPHHLVELLGDELWMWDTLPWWKNLWGKSDLVSIDIADTLPNGFELWFRIEKAENEYIIGPWDDDDETDIFIEDNGEYIGLIRLIATKK